MIRVNEVKLSVDEDRKLLKNKIAKKLRISPEEISAFSIFKESIDARKRHEISFVYIVDVEVTDEERVLRKNKSLQKSPDFRYRDAEAGDGVLKHRPVVVGTGPAGMFAGLILAQRGYRPILLERGQDVDTRTRDVEEFWQNRKLNPESNVQFGEGGAGTFSDGKLTTRTKDLRSRKALEEFVVAGAPEEILYAAKPHIGTDILKSVVKNIRGRIIELGGEVRFGSKVTDVLIENGRVAGIIINDKEKLPAEAVILAIGHSARDTYQMLHAREVNIRQKPFSIGVRIEHPQTLINVSQYKEQAEHPQLGAADYRLTYQSKNGRSVYTFCMCPGGTVVAAASEPHTVVTNGMSEYARDSENANSAVLVQVGPEDFGSDHPLAGIEYQREWEKAAFVAGGQNYNAPAQLVGDFLAEKPSTQQGDIKPSYLPAVTFTDLKQCLPAYVVESLQDAIASLDKKLRGFARSDAVLTGVETRSSAPVRIERDSETMQSMNVTGLYPIGEGAGYAGGIISATVDGIKVAEKIIGKFKPFSG
ncbi:NAD(P)/FAD-dependent oxidoreductase [Dethiobacter alkaliphilus]|uniref:NAD(P)/FAD-dependent oxidoreductase n=1 Tax=Dethiobacter alkaliphilus TaxID=427926 RepID=UPI002227626D|nr:NAD(P)/FAD-dependent oxidoreductase [Dethiobacter alkaliphilus]MCW3490651.1 NAD(P)/FAD-dependent oxidoreductase [Dethiobacter alkaliphilus]